MLEEPSQTEEVASTPVLSSVNRQRSQSTFPMKLCICNGDNSMIVEHVSEEVLLKQRMVGTVPMRDGDQSGQNVTLKDLGVTSKRQKEHIYSQFKICIGHLMRQLFAVCPSSLRKVKAHAGRQWGELNNVTQWMVLSIYAFKEMKKCMMEDEAGGMEEETRGDEAVAGGEAATADSTVTNSSPLGNVGAYSNQNNEFPTVGSSLQQHEKVAGSETSASPTCATFSSEDFDSFFSRMNSRSSMSQSPPPVTDFIPHSSIVMGFLDELQDFYGNEEIFNSSSYHSMDFYLHDDYVSPALNDYP